MFFALGLLVPQAIPLLLLIVFVVVYRNMPSSTVKVRYLLSVLAATLSGLVGAYLSAFPAAADMGLPIFYSHSFKWLDIWYLLN